MISLVKSMAFATGVVGVFLTFAAWSTLQQINRLDAEWEQVTLSQWIEGETKNQILFEISEFEAGDEYWALSDREDDGFSMVYIPLYRSGEMDESGEAAVAIVGVRNAKDPAPLEEILSNQVLNVQDYRSSMPPFTGNLNDPYPKLDFSKTRWAIVDTNLPSMSTVVWFFGFGVPLTIVSMICFYYGWALKKRSSGFQCKEVKQANSSIHAADLSVAGRQKLVSPCENTNTDSRNQLLKRVGKVCGFISFGLIPLNLAIVGVMKLAIVDESLLFQILCVTFPIFLLTGAIGATSYFLLKPVLKISALRADQIPPVSLQALHPLMNEFCRLGFEIVGYAESEHFEQKFNGYLISPSKRKLVEVSVKAKGKNATFAIVGISNGGCVIEVGIPPAGDGFGIDGEAVGVPLDADFRGEFNPFAALRAFESYAKAVRSRGGRLLTIPLHSIFHLMHYESILADWWAYRKSVRFSKPVDSLPEKSEVTEDGETFTFSRSSEFDHALAVPETDERVDLNAAVAVIAQPLPSAEGISSI